MVRFHLKPNNQHISLNQQRYKEFEIKSKRWKNNKIMSLSQTLSHAIKEPD